MVTDIERVADQCADICEIMITYPDLHFMKVPQTVMTMFERATEMFAEAIDSFIRQDAELASTIRPKDDVVDSLSRAQLSRCPNLFKKIRPLYPRRQIICL